MRLTLLLCILVIVLMSVPAQAEPDDGPVRFSGYARNFLVYSDQDEGTTREAIALLRLKLDGELAQELKWETAYELAPWYRDMDSGTFPTAASEGTGYQYRVDDFERVLWPDDPDVDEDFVLVHNLDRAALYYRAQGMDLTLGRQAVAFGSARTVNPTDVLAPYAFTTLAKEERVGMDALRVKVPTGRLGELDAGVVAGDEAKRENSAGFFRMRSYIAMMDITLMAMVFRENKLLGLDVTRSIGGAGTWLEAAQVFADAGSDENYFRASAGMDYSFTEDLYAWMEYHYNGPGSRDPEDYPSAVDDTAYTEGAVYLLGRNYLAPGFTYQVTPLLSASFQLLWNMDDGSTLFAPSVEYSLADDATARAGGYAGYGDSSGTLRAPESEFGEYPDIWYLSASFYF